MELTIMPEHTRRTAGAAAALLATFACGCRLLEAVPHARAPLSAILDPSVARATLQPDESGHDMPLPLGPSEPIASPEHTGSEQPLESLIQQALAANRRVQAARWEAMAMKARVPQMTALEDPMVQNGTWPFPSNAPQYSLMGYMPYELMITQQFPWLGTLRLRGLVAEQEARVALLALAEAQLDVVAEVKRAHASLVAAERVIVILAQNRSVAEEIVELARIRLESGGSQQDVLRAEVAVDRIDQELVETRRQAIEARAELCALLDLPPDAELHVDLTPHPLSDLPARADHLYQLAVAARPELHMRRAEVARDQGNLALARKRYMPNFTLGVGYSTMTQVNNPSPLADGRDNVGFILGFNLPIYRAKLDAGVCEAEARIRASASAYEANRDRTFRDIRTAFADVQAQGETLALLRGRIAPKSRLALESALSGYRAGTLDFVTLNTAREELLAIEQQIANVEAALARALAQLERNVGTGLGQLSGS